MRRLALFAALASAVFATAAPATQARDQPRSKGDALILKVRPRSYLDAGKVVSPGSMNGPASGIGQARSYLSQPPYIGTRESFGAGVLPDPVTNGPFVGARNPFGPVDFRAPRARQR